MESTERRTSYPEPRTDQQTRDASDAIIGLDGFDGGPGLAGRAANGTIGADGVTVRDKHRGALLDGRTKSTAAEAAHWDNPPQTGHEPTVRRGNTMRGKKFTSATLRAGLILAWTIAFIAAGASSASAGTPTKTSFSGTYGPLSFPCTGFTDLVTNGVFSAFTIEYNSAGAWGTLSHENDTEMDTNSVTGKQILVREAWDIRVDQTTGNASVTGDLFMSTFGGQGVLIHDAGLVVLDPDGNIILEAGFHDVTDNGQQAFCSALE
jgi:hypothetical protein